MALLGIDLGTIGCKAILFSSDGSRLAKSYREYVMITGAGGSIGSEMTRQLLQLKPKTLVLFDVSEAALYEISLEIGVPA